MKYGFYKACKIRCYTHKTFEDRYKWNEHNDEYYYNIIQDTLLNNHIIKKIGNIEALIIPKYGIIALDQELDKKTEKIVIEAIYKSLRRDGISIEVI